MARSSYKLLLWISAFVKCALLPVIPITCPYRCHTFLSPWDNCRDDNQVLKRCLQKLCRNRTAALQAGRHPKLKTALIFEECPWQPKSKKEKSATRSTSSWRHDSAATTPRLSISTI